MGELAGNEGGAPQGGAVDSTLVEEEGRLAAEGNHKEAAAAEGDIQEPGKGKHTWAPATF